ncbi:MAG TPA: AAA family ATPase [Thermoanaerobaculia bacterium]|nr:AAA family ATPase [Thermoanaerobaculia bacterium]
MPESALFHRAPDLEALIAAIDSSGFTFEPWQIATYVTALRTKPFVILAGVTGTGKSQLPQLVSRFTGGAHELIAVRPDWTDSADVLGFTNLQGVFQPGAVLRDARRANDNPDRFFACILDEMNLARVEQYFAEVLSFIESRDGTRSFALVPNSDAEWRDVHLSPNFAIVGTVNMDESSHGFSRKVLDRAFTLELSEIDLRRWRIEARDEAAEAAWPVSAWLPRARQLGRATLAADEIRRVESIIELLVQANGYLSEAQLQIAYRSRDEIALFVLNANDVASSFRTRSGEPVDPLDIALHMKLLPRIIGGSEPVHRALIRLLGWSIGGMPYSDAAAAAEAVQQWAANGRGAAIRDARFPRTAARLCLMYDRLIAEGSTSFWL